MSKTFFALSLLLTATAVSGCARETVYVRLDGQRAASDPILAQQFEVDRTICSGEMQKANVSGVTFAGGGLAGAIAAAERSNAVGQVAQGCMAQKGYLLVAADQAEAKNAELAAITEEKKKREALAQVPIRLPEKKSRSATANN